MINKIYILIFCIAFTIPMYSQNEIVFHQKSGGTISYAFSEKPVVTYVGNNLCVNTETRSVEFPLEDLLMTTFNVNENAIDILTSEGDSKNISVYSTDGKLVKKIPNKDGRTTISIKDLSEGTYIIKSGNTTYKINKR